ncbi:MAG: hypothetical protein AVDCRST_MAG12-1351 [uncultured Rubrobacteraceae bacterium]|uniref:Uncharacterized protein n=1 Tax=uncultured Rubrobacteraceae bacterium TaxID=349277 RepID=A0A6J4RPI5_9ACTN|nr:MAG: hypothetical protein AVDCRST_MAG12-1351 [uncultured Rubrobacteraceae bacterium]
MVPASARNQNPAPSSDRSKGLRRMWSLRRCSFALALRKSVRKRR